MINFTETVRNSADIVRVVSDYVSLKGAGSTLKGLCPFHSEKTPSFSVHRDKQFFYCFGCHNGGDVFSFVMLAERVSFPEAVEIVAEKFGVPIPARTGVEDPVASGLLVKNDRGEVYDRFRRRLMFPISNERGKVIGFGGRALLADVQPKYLNSPESPLYSK